MKKTGISKISRWLWFYLALMMLVSALTFLLVYQEIDNTLSPQLSEAATSAAASADSQGQQRVQSQLAGFKLRVLLLMTAGLAVMFLIGLLWSRTAANQINKPVRTIGRAVSRLAAGNLNETVRVDSADEFGRIGNNINELAANLQELLLYIWKQTGECMVHIEQANAQAADPMDSRATPVRGESLEKLSEAVGNLREMAQAYVFYDVRLEGKQALAIKEPGRIESDADLP